MRSNLSRAARIFLGLTAAMVVIAMALGGLLLIRHSRQSRVSQSAKPSPLGDFDAVAPLQELAEPWSSKAFVFHKPDTKEAVSSIVVRLPDSAADESRSYWAFSLQPLFGHCRLEYITDPQKLSTDYKFEARHPMVADPCTRAAFDPLQMADMPGGAWARGAIVKGSAFRPPIGIEIVIRSDQLVATKME